MPSTEQLLAALKHIANAWRPLAVAWHVHFAVLAGMLVTGLRPPRLLTGVLLGLPLLSVSSVAWLSGNPFNGAVYALVAVLLIFFSFRLRSGRVRIAPPWLLVPGTLMFLFGWVYPHFLQTTSFLTYVYAAPVGIIPCATLTTVIGLTLALDGLDSRAFALTLGVPGLFYGFTGVGQVRVFIDVVLLLGAILLTVRAFLRRPEPRPTEQQVTGRMTAWGVGPRIGRASLPYLGLMLAIHFGWPRVSLMTPRPSPFLFAAGVGLIVVGIVLWAQGAGVIDRAFNSGRLLTSGAYAIVRNPMYSGIIVFGVPGVALMLRSWPVLTAAAYAYVAFRLFIKEEEGYLQEKFGPEFAKYRARVNAIVPLPRLRSRTSTGR